MLEGQSERETVSGPQRTFQSHQHHVIAAGGGPPTSSLKHNRCNRTHLHDAVVADRFVQFGRRRDRCAHARPAIRLAVVSHGEIGSGRRRGASSRAGPGVLDADARRIGRGDGEMIAAICLMGVDRGRVPCNRIGPRGQGLQPDGKTFAVSADNMRLALVHTLSGAICDLNGAEARLDGLGKDNSRFVRRLRCVCPPAAPRFGDRSGRMPHLLKRAGWGRRTSMV